MKAEITYQLRPWDNPFGNKEIKSAWCLVKVTIAEYGDTRFEPVAVFNLDSQAQSFQGHLLSCMDAGIPPIRLDDDTVQILRGLRNDIE